VPAKSRVFHAHIDPRHVDPRHVLKRRELEEGVLLKLEIREIPGMVHVFFALRK
jgi:hypothetical protein